MLELMMNQAIARERVANLVEGAGPGRTARAGSSSSRDRASERRPVEPVAERHRRLPVGLRFLRPSER
jgi:hypothetical protein